MVWTNLRTEKMSNFQIEPVLYTENNSKIVPALADPLYKQLGRKFSQILLYGYKICGYDSFAKEIFQEAGILAWNYRDRIPGTIDIPPEKLHSAEKMKNELVRLVLSNLTRQYGNFSNPIIPCLFCIDTDTCLINDIDISKSSPIGSAGHFTTKEMRRTYKLCFDPSLPVEVRQMALQTFIFVKVNKGFDKSTDETSFEVISPPWNNQNIKKKLDQRIEYGRLRRSEDRTWRRYCWVELAKLNKDQLSQLNNSEREKVFSMIKLYNALVIRKSLICYLRAARFRYLRDEEIKRDFEKDLAHLYDPTGSLANETRIKEAGLLIQDANRPDLASFICNSSDTSPPSEHLNASFR